MIDFRWCSEGGLLLDSTGDIALSSADGSESLRDMVRTRLKAALTGWQLYDIGADLDRRVGDVIDEELELSLQRQVERSLSGDLLPSGSFQVETLAESGRIHILVYVQKQLIAQTTVTAGVQ